MIGTDNFLLISYPQGAAGKFLSSVLMASKSVAHFDPKLESNKINELCLEYIKSSFTKDLSHWIRTEPNHADAWNLHFISSKFPRGDDLTIEQFIALCQDHATKHFQNSIREKKIILFPWHKNYDTKIFNNSKKVTILVDPPSYQWFDTSLWHKHYGLENGKVVLRVNDSRLHPKMKEYYLKFNNPLYSDDPVDQFYETNITNNPDKLKFANSSQFADRKNNICINLSNILDVEKFILTVNNICSEFKLAPIDEKFIRAGHSHWISCHEI